MGSDCLVLLDQRVPTQCDQNSKPDTGEVANQWKVNGLGPIHRAVSAPTGGMYTPVCLRETGTLVSMGVGIRSSNVRGAARMLLPLPSIMQKLLFSWPRPTNIGVWCRLSV